LTISAGTITFNNAFVSPVVVPANPQLTSGTLLPPPTVSLSDPLLTNSPLTLQNNNTVPYLAYIPGSPINIDSSIGVSGGATIGFVSGGTLTLNGFTGSTLAITGTGTLPLSGGIYVNGSIVTLANPGSGGVPLLGPSQLLADGWIETEPGTYVSPTGQTLKITTPPTP
jgi:hypothetical protein